MSKIYKYLVVFTSVFILISCGDKLEEIGPRICPPADFSFSSKDIKLFLVDKKVESNMENAGGELDLSRDGLRITADFGSSLPWSITLSNSKSQEKTYSGNSDKIDIYWYGQPSKLIDDKMYFDEGEVTLELNLLCMDPITKTFNVSGVQKFNNLNNKFGLLLRDWDKNGIFPILTDAYSPADGWTGGAAGADPFEFEYYDTDPSPAGGKHAFFRAVMGAPSWYLGATDFPITGLQDSLNTENVDSLYLNIFVKSNPDLPNSGAEIGLKATTKAYLKTEAINWDGWKLLSYQFSEFKRGSTTLDTTRLTSVILQLGAQPEEASELSVQYDFVLVTYGAPLFEE
jgi:hypothetical protein